MHKRLVVTVLAVVVSMTCSPALAQCGCSYEQVSYAPVVPTYATYYAPTVTYYAPTPYVTYYAPAAPRVTYYAPVVQPYTACYTPAVQPVVAYYGVAGWSMYGTPRIYMPGQPVRNTLRAVFP